MKESSVVLVVDDEAVFRFPVGVVGAVGRLFLPTSGHGCLLGPAKCRGSRAAPWESDSAVARGCQHAQESGIHHVGRVASEGVTDHGWRWSVDELPVNV